MAGQRIDDGDTRKRLIAGVGYRKAIIDHLKGMIDFPVAAAVHISVVARRRGERLDDRYRRVLVDERLDGRTVPDLLIIGYTRGIADRRAGVELGLRHDMRAGQRL